MNRWLHVGVKGRAAWPTNETTIEFGGRQLVLKPATRETEQSIHINLRGISDVDALNPYPLLVAKACSHLQADKRLDFRFDVTA